MQHDDAIGVVRGEPTIQPSLFGSVELASGSGPSVVVAAMLDGTTSTQATNANAHFTNAGRRVRYAFDSVTRLPVTLIVAQAYSAGIPLPEPGHGLPGLQTTLCSAAFQD